MRYPGKRNDPTLVGARYGKKRENARILAGLLEEQRGFCAYSERWISSIDGADVEHFDPRLKSTDADGHRNWYAVLHKLNLEKPRKIEPVLPVLDPSSDLPDRIRVVHGHFEPIDANDIEARHLIDFLGWNRRELFEERRKHVLRVGRMLERGISLAELSEDPANLSFATALEAELTIAIPND